MKGSHHNRQALLDRLEKKYIKKIQTQKYKKNSQRLKASLHKISGYSLPEFRRKPHDLLDYVDYEVLYP